MESTRYVLLPGLDGTDLLLNRFCELAPNPDLISVVPLPDDPANDYRELCELLTPRIRETGGCHLIAESFSGPLGILLAHCLPDIVKRLTLVASFADSPIPFFARWLPWSMLFRVPLPQFMARFLFVGSDGEMGKRLRLALQKTTRHTLVQRMRFLSQVNVCLELGQIRCPIRYIRPTQDRLVSRRSLNKILAANKRVSVREVDGPHLIMQTRPQQTWSAIQDNSTQPTLR